MCSVLPIAPSICYKHTRRRPASCGGMMSCSPRASCRCTSHAPPHTITTTSHGYRPKAAVADAGQTSHGWRRKTVPNNPLCSSLRASQAKPSTARCSARAWPNAGAAVLLGHRHGVRARSGPSRRSRAACCHEFSCPRRDDFDGQAAEPSHSVPAAPPRLFWDASRHLLEIRHGIPSREQHHDCLQARITLDFRQRALAACGLAVRLRDLPYFQPLLRPQPFGLPGDHEHARLARSAMGSSSPGAGSAALARAQDSGFLLWLPCSCSTRARRPVRKMNTISASARGHSTRANEPAQRCASTGLA